MTSAVAGKVNRLQYPPHDRNFGLPCYEGNNSDPPAIAYDGLNYHSARPLQHRRYQFVARTTPPTPAAGTHSVHGPWSPSRPGFLWMLSLPSG